MLQSLPTRSAACVSLQCEVRKKLSSAMAVLQAAILERVSCCERDEAAAADKVAKLTAKLQEEEQAVLVSTAWLCVIQTRLFVLQHLPLNAQRPHVRNACPVVLQALLFSMESRQLTGLRDEVMELYLVCALAGKSIVASVQRACKLGRNTQCSPAACRIPSWRLKMNCSRWVLQCCRF